jgi:hypothetical protein
MDDEDYGINDDYTLSRVDDGEGASFILSWVASYLFGEDSTRKATRRVLYEVS